MQKGLVPYFMEHLILVIRLFVSKVICKTSKDLEHLRKFLSILVGLMTLLVAVSSKSMNVI